MQGRLRTPPPPPRLQRAEPGGQASLTQDRISEESIASHSICQCLLRSNSDGVQWPYSLVSVAWHGQFYLQASLGPVLTEAMRLCPSGFAGAAAWLVVAARLSHLRRAEEPRCACARARVCTRVFPCSGQTVYCYWKTFCLPAAAAS